MLTLRLFGLLQVIEKDARLTDSFKEDKIIFTKKADKDDTPKQCRHSGFWQDISHQLPGPWTCAREAKGSLALLPEPGLSSVQTWGSIVGRGGVWGGAGTGAGPGARRSPCPGSMSGSGGGAGGGGLGPHALGSLCIVDLVNPWRREGFALKQESYCLHSTAYHLIRKICF